MPQVITDPSLSATCIIHYTNTLNMPQLCICKYMVPIQNVRSGKGIMTKMDS